MHFEIGWFEQSAAVSEMNTHDGIIIKIIDRYQRKKAIKRNI